jgi:hypothetical protein
MASEKAALEFQLEKSLKQFHEVQVLISPHSVAVCPNKFTADVLILLPFCYQCPLFDRSKQKGVKLLADQLRRGKKILISRH